MVPGRNVRSTPSSARTAASPARPGYRNTTPSKATVLSSGTTGFDDTPSSSSASRSSSLPAAAAACCRLCMAIETVSRAVGRIIAISVEPTTSIGSTHPLRANHVPPARLMSRISGAESMIDATASNRSSGPT